MRIAYFAHNLDDPAIARRIRMLQLGGAELAVAGFRRGDGDVVPLHGVMPVNLGRTQDARLVRRMASVVAARLPDAFLSGADLILARNLEMLAIAMRHRRRTGRTIPVVYECLDIHRLMAGKGLPGRLLRGLEGRLSRGASLLLTSSPAFVSEYFASLSNVSLPTLLVENKVLETEDTPPPAPAVPARQGPPWRIGWFGAIRCSRSLAILGSLAKAMNGQVEVVIRGRPAYSEFADFHAQVARLPHVSFLGPYDAGDLPAIYGDVHFAWAIDFFEQGLNSAWLRPNRVYESGRYAAVPIAQASVETGRFLSGSGVGILLGHDVEADLRTYFESLSPGGYEWERAKVAALPARQWSYGPADFGRLVALLEDVADGKHVESAVL